MSHPPITSALFFAHPYFYWHLTDISRSLGRLEQQKDAKMFDLVREDLYRKAEWYSLPRTRRSWWRMAVSDGSSAQVIYRMMRWCQTHRFKLGAMFLYRFNAHLSHALIGRNADFGPGFVMVHSFGVVINSAVKAGRNLVIEHGVTIGAEKDLSPTLGDNVFIGAGAKIIGSVRIGNDVKIGANAVVTKDLPDGATAVGIPARIVKIYGERVSSAQAELSLPTLPEWEAISEMSIR